LLSASRMGHPQSQRQPTLREKNAQDGVMRETTPGSGDVGGKAASSRRTSMKRPCRVKGDGFCERCGYTSIRARGTKGECISSAAPSPNRPRRT